MSAIGTPLTVFSALSTLISKGPAIGIWPPHPNRGGERPSSHGERPSGSPMAWPDHIVQMGSESFLEFLQELTRTDLVLR